MVRVCPATAPDVVQVCISYVVHLGTYSTFETPTETNVSVKLQFLVLYEVWQHLVM